MQNSTVLPELGWLHTYSSTETQVLQNLIGRNSWS